MNRYKKIVKRLTTLNGWYYAFYCLLRKTGILSMLSDETSTKIEYKANMGKPLNLANPESYNEKLQWLKLYDHNPFYTKLVDKYAVKSYISTICNGGGYVIPTLGVWDRVEDIELDTLPNQFVLKTNHSGGNTGVVICRDKSTFDFEEAKRKLEKSLATDMYKVSREWPYKNVKRCILAEEYMEDKKTGELRDYKFFCFNGEPKALFVASGRQNHSEPFFDFFDMDYNHLDLKCPHPQADIIPEKPESFEEMKELARKLSKGLPHVRVDLYEINGKPYFGELTLYHWEGLMPFYPESWNYKFGEWLDISDLKKC